MRVKNLNYALSVFLFILSLVWIGIYKFNFGIDFAGGITKAIQKTTAYLKENNLDLKIIVFTLAIQQNF